MSCNHDDDDHDAISAPAEAATNSGTGSLPKGVGQPQTVNLLAQNELGISGRSAPGEAVPASALTPSFGGCQTSISVKTFGSVFGEITPRNANSCLGDWSVFRERGE